MAALSFSVVGTTTQYSTTTVSSPTTTFTSTVLTSFQIVDRYSNSVLLSEEWWSFANTPTSSTTGLTASSSTTSTLTRTGESSVASSVTRSASATTHAIQSTQAYSNSNLSRGATAGIAVGCAIAGLVVGIIAGCFLFRRRRRQGPEIGYHTAQLGSQEKPVQEIPTDRLELDQFLLDSSPDAEIRTELRSLNHLLQQHVENNYHLRPVSRNADELSQTLLQLGLGQGGTMTTAKLASLSLDPTHRHNAIQHVIAKVVFASIAFNEPSPFSLLPQPVSSFVSMIPAVEGRRGNTEAVNIALTRWRQLSAFLLHSERSDRTPLTPPEEVSTHKAQQLAMSLNAFLEPFVAEGREERYEQENHIREVIAECATFGYHLFSEPSEYRFRFEDGVSPFNIVVCPGLDRISDEEGRRYPPPAQPIVAPVVESI
ncbi:hypothetical protein F4818DRAFT_96181 [Hypoxylon cercidicola]|nr:hypothetical protein F4818DRAFT_96181 [Hypoxylon cercidicola]